MKQTKIYLAHNFEARDYLASVVKPYLESKGHEITSRWLVEDTHVDHGNARQSAITDLADVESANVLMFFTDKFGEKPGQGKYIELGYGLRAGKTIIIVGSDWESCVFYHLPNLIRCRDYMDVVEYL